MNDPRSLTRAPLAKRLTQVVSYGLSGGWFTPEMPLYPQQPQTAGRRLDYLAGYNISTRPRRDSGIDFQTLRNFAYYCDLIRILIERRKDQIATFEWTVSPSDDAIAAGEDQDELKERAASAVKFLKNPDGRNTWSTWLRIILEDMLVLDGVCVWPVYRGNQLLRLEQVSPETIKIVIDESGRRPEPPYPAYQQVLHGVPTADFQKDELLYFISNPASNRIYGWSKVEQILVTVQMMLRRESSQLAYFTDGNVPAALIGAPDNWTTRQIEDAQAGLDAMLSGDLAARRKLWLVPFDANKSKQFIGEEALLKTPFDEWLMRIACFNFGIAPTPFINQVNRATAFSAAQEARDEGLGPALMFLKDMMDAIIGRCLRIGGVEFKWEMEPENDPDSQSQIDDRQLRNGSRSIDELRQRDGLDPIGVGPMVYTPQGPIPLEMVKDGSAPNLKPPSPPPGADGGPAGDKPPEDGKPDGSGGASNSGKKDKHPGDVDMSESDPEGELEATKQEGRPSRDEPFRRLYSRPLAKTTRYYTKPKGHRHTAVRGGSPSGKAT